LGLAVGKCEIGGVGNKNKGELSKMCLGEGLEKKFWRRL